MALYSQTIKNLVAGISQQPPILRHPEQLEFQQNAMSTEVAGLQKRPPTLHIKTLLNSVIIPGIKPLIHIINRDEYEKYIVMFNGQEIHIWDLTGNKMTVNYETGAQPYITTSQPRKKLKAVTVADYTFLTNTDIATQMTSETTPNVWATQGALVNIKSGQYGRTYEIILNNASVAAYQTPDGSQQSHSKNIDTNYIAGQLAANLSTNGFTVTKGEGWLYITKPGTQINIIETKDGFNNQAMFGILKTTQKFSNLPAQAPDGFTVMIQGEPGSGADDYYVFFDATNKIWKETAKPGILNTIDATTMPHTLIREADGTFTFKKAEWSTRKTGDDDSNPEPSFINQKIFDLFFFRNRLGFVAGENVILSKSAEFFQFWMSSAVQLQDTDPIDLAVSHNTVSTLYHAVPFSEELLLFSAQTQFVLRAEGVLSPKNARIDQMTEFDCLTAVRPVGAGKNIYFPTEREEYTSIKEYYAVQDVTNIKNAQDITAHVPFLIPNGVHKMISNTTENILLALTEGDQRRIYVYKYLFLNEQQLQAAWSHWDFGDTAAILGGGFIGSTLYLIIQRGSSLFLEKMTFTYNTKDFDQEPYRIFMDRKILTAPLPPSVYNSVIENSTINLNSFYDGTTIPPGEYGVVTTDGVFRRLTAAELATGSFVMPGDHTGKQLIIGQLIKWKGIFSEIMIKIVDEKGTRSNTEGRLQLRNFWVNYQDSGSFEMSVEHKDKETYRYTMTGRILGSSSTLFGSAAISSGQFKFPVQSLSSNCVISFDSDAPTPVALIGAGWEGMYYKRTNTVQ